MSEQTTPDTGSLTHAGTVFANLLSVGDEPAEDKRVGDSKPEQQSASAETAEQAPAAPETKSESEQAAPEANAEAEATTETPTTYKALVNGQEVEVTLEEALKGYSRTQDYTQKTQALAAQKREFEEKELSAVRLERQQYADYLGKWVDVLKANTPAEPDPSKMDPGEFAVEWVKWKQHNDHVAQAQAEQARVKSVQDADADRGFREYVAGEQQKLAEAIPALRDPEKASGVQRDLVEYATTRGFTKQELESVTDHRMVLLLHDAMQAQKAKAKAPEISNKIKAALATSGPGADTPAKKPDAIAAAQNKLKQSGRVEDAGAVFAQLL